MKSQNENQQLLKVISKIRKIRKTKGFTHEYIALKLNISPSTYNKIELLNSKLTLERLLEIQEVLDVPLWELLDIRVQNIYNQEIFDNQIGLQQVENLYQDNKDLAEKHIQTLKEEVAFLKTLIPKP